MHTKPAAMRMKKPQFSEEVKNNHLQNPPVKVVTMSGSYQPNTPYFSSNLQIHQQLPHASTYNPSGTVAAGSSLMCQSSEQQQYPKIYIHPPGFPVNVLQIPHWNQSYYNSPSGLLADQQQLLQIPLHYEFAFVPYGHVEQPLRTIRNYPPILMTGMLQTPRPYQLCYYSPNMQMLQTQPLLTSTSADSATVLVGPSACTSVHNEASTNLPNEVPQQFESVGEYRPDDQDLDNMHLNAFSQGQEEEQVSMKHSGESQVQCDLNGEGLEEQSALTLTDQSDLEQTTVEAHMQNDAEASTSSPNEVQGQEEELASMKHSGESQVQCDLTEEGLEQQSALTLTDHCDLEQIEIEAHRQNKFQCGQCGKRISSQRGLAKHERIHTEVKLYRCDVCDKKYSQLCNLKCHMRIHTGEKPYQCHVCQKKFLRLSTLQRHMQTHTGEKPYECNVCNKKFSHLHNLKCHVRIHTGEKPYQCNVCHKKFSQLRTLQQHMRIHTGEKPYQCDVCHKKFSQLCALQNHMRIHTGERPYQCDVCHKQFSQLCARQNHMRIHTGKKPYQCDVCHKTFLQKCALQSHMRIHAEEKL